MATITKLGKADARNRLGATPWGNVSALFYRLATNASGAVVGADSTSAVAVGDKVRIGILPAGFRIFDSELIVKTGMTATITGKLGFEYVDGVDDAGVPQDDDFFGTGLNLAAAARLRNATTNTSVVLPKDAYLILTTAEAANAKASELEAVVLATAEGAA